MPRTTAAVRWGCLWAVLALMAACGYFGGSHSAASHPSPTAAAHALKPTDPAARATIGMVEAVPMSGTAPPIELRFSIRNRPQVGQDDEIDYALIPQVAGLDTVRIAFAALTGLQVVNQGPTLAAIKPASGVPILGSVSVRPTQPGLFTLNAAVAVDSESRSVVWTFTIPVITGDGPAQTAANAP